MQKYTEISEDTTLEASREQLLDNDKTAISNSSAATAPSSPLVGQSWFDTNNNEFKVWNGTAWIATGSTDVATTSSNGLMSASDKTKLDGVAANANNYSHPNSGVTAGTYKSVTVNAQGHVTGGSNPTTLAGYGITDANINNGKITLGGNTITPLTSHQSLTDYLTKADASAIYAVGLSIVDGQICATYNA